MSDKSKILPQTGLQFFGRISASISHEIKNVLAIINENAGLLEDLTLMADRGQPIDPARLKIMAAAVQKQIGRADSILKNMNRFAHSIDENNTAVKMDQTVELFMALTERFRTMRGVEVDLQLPESSPTIQTAPFFLMNLLWQCMDLAMSACGDEKRFELVIEETANSVRLHFRKLAGLAAALPEIFPSESGKGLIAVLAADLTADAGGGEIVLRLPK